MISQVVSTLHGNIEALNSAARRVSQPEQNVLVADFADLIVAEHAVEASIAALRQLNRVEGHIIDILA